MVEQLCPVCGCTIFDGGYEKEGIKYCCEPFATGGGPCDFGCCYPVKEEDRQ